MPDLAVAIQHHQNGRSAEAEAAYRAIVAADPGNGQAWNNLGILLKNSGRFAEAGDCYALAVRHMAEPTAAYNNWALALYQQRRYKEAAQVCCTALVDNPGSAESFFNLANALRAESQAKAAVDRFERAVAIDPGHVAAWTNLGDAYKSMGLGERAIAASRRAAEFAPGLLEPWANLADALKEHGRIAEAIPYYAQALANNPTHAPAHSNLLLALNYAEGRDGLANLKAHGYWGQVQADPLTPAAPRFANSPDPERRISVGFVSGDFRTHSVAYFLEPLVERLDREAFRVACYSVTAQPDPATERFARAACLWRHDPSIGDEALAERVRADQIDILIDVAGHTGNNRLLTFARKPAPVQATWLGYPNTTGVKAIDWRITDAVSDPLGEHDAHYVERLYRLPAGFLCYRPLAPDYVPEVVPPPCLERGHITFGSFNNVAKTGPATLALWARVLAAVPGSRLVLKGAAFADESTRSRFLAVFAARGVGPERIDLLARIPDPRSHFAVYHDIDIALDPFPYNGTTTTCEALWMGVPVVTMLGRIHAARVGASLMVQAGLGHLVAPDEDGYVATAAALAANPAHLASLRRTMRQRLGAGPLRDEEGFARNFGVALRTMWSEWCRTRVGAPAEAPA